MESTIDLILKGHFETLKKEVNEKSIHLFNQTNLKETLNQVVKYLEKDDTEKAKALRDKVLDLLASVDKEAPVTMKKKPMKKAGGKKREEQGRKAI